MGAGPGPAIILRVWLSSGQHPGHHPASLCYHPAWQDDIRQKTQTNMLLNKNNGAIMNSISPQKPNLGIISAHPPAWQDDCPAGQDERMNHPGLGPSSCPMYKSACKPLQIIGAMDNDNTLGGN